MRESLNLNYEYTKQAYALKNSILENEIFFLQSVGLIHQLDATSQFDFTNVLDELKEKINEKLGAQKGFQVLPPAGGLSSAPLLSYSA